MTLFGGTGDLTYRKLIPAFLNLHVRKVLPKSFRIVVIGRRDFNDDTYRQNLIPWLREHARFDCSDNDLYSFLDIISYFKMVFTEEEGYVRLSDYFNDLDAEAGMPHKQLYYFAVDPSYFTIIAKHLKKHGLADNSSIIIEKPFGNDLESSVEINNTLQSIFTNKHIYRIDHYLAKEVVQKILPIRFENPLFMDKWNKDFIKSIEISIFEEVGVEKRGNFYDVTGALKDMVHSHLLQVLSLLIMDKPNSMSSDDLHKVQEEVLETLFVRNPKEDVVYGQYDSYRDEPAVNDDSHTETFVALRLESSNPVWDGVPFYIQTGKKLQNRHGEIVVTFDDNVKLNFEIQPKECIALYTEHGDPIHLKDHDMCGDVDKNAPEAYERLLQAAMHEDNTLFVSFKQVALCWDFIETILKETEDNPIFPYISYSSGPKEKHLLTEKDNLKWNE